MQPGRFVILTGHLNDYPLSDLVGILRHQRKTGRLLIEYPKGPASFFFKDGELVDAQLENLSGLQAVCVAVAQPASSFNFNPLIQPPKRSIENSMQKVVSELLGCWDESGSDIDAIAPARSAFNSALASQAAPQPALLASAPASFNVSPTTQTEQALVFSSVALQVPKTGYSRGTLAMVAASVMMLGLSVVIALTGAFGGRGATAVSLPSVSAGSNLGSEDVNKTPLAATEPEKDLTPPAESAKSRNNTAGGESRRKPNPAIDKSPEVNAANHSFEVAPANKATPVDQAKFNEPSSSTQSVKVVVRIENGRVAQASVANPRPGMNAYEALALRIARQRRYPTKATGAETVTIRVTPSN